MTTDRSTERIIDLLYGELSSEEEAELRAELAESAELRSELSGYETLVGRIREVMPEEDVSGEVRSSIMDAARAAAGSTAERAPRRRPDDRDSDENGSTGFWGRIASGQGSQLALVAVVLIAGAFVVKFLDGTSSNPAMAPASDISNAAEVLPAPVRREKEAAVVETETAAEELAEDEAPTDLPEEPAQVASGESQLAFAEPSADEVKNRERSLAAELEAQPEELRAPQERVEPPAAPAEAKPRKAERKAKSAPARRSPAKKSARPAPKSETAQPTTLDLFEGSSGPVDGLGRADDDALSTRSDVERGQGRGRGSGSSIPPAAEPTPDYARQEQSAAPPSQYRPAPGSIAAVDARFRQRDYRGTIAAADAFARQGGGSETEKARALHLKAQSMMALGDYTGASRVFDAIQKDYPSYRPGEITQARAEANNRLRARRQQQAAPSPAEAEADNAAERIPASHD